MTPLQHAYDVEFSENGDQGQGWCFGAPAGIAPSQWPRSRVNGLPMAHVFTLRVPAEYRTKSEELIAISLFQADDHAADTVDGVAETIEMQELPEEANESDEAGPFWASLLEYATGRHPQERYLEDLIDGGWAVLWLTEAEFRGPAGMPPAEAVGVFPEYDSSDGTSAYIAPTAPQYVELVVRTGDPNVGKEPKEFPDEAAGEYVPMYSGKGQALGLDKLFFGKTHFGGTSSPCQGEPDTSPFYLEFDEQFGGANLGGDGVAFIDLLNDRLDWACG